jgi:putative N6-adenine-specific DNA methylase
MNHLQLFLPCAGGVEELLAHEVHRIIKVPVSVMRGGVMLEGSWRDAMLLNLHSRLAMRVMIELAHKPYQNERDLYDAASEVAWEIWFTPKNTFKIEMTSQHSPLKSLNFAALTIKDAVADRFRNKYGVRPDVDTHWPHVRVHAHLTTDAVTLYIDTSGEPLFKRGWRQDTGEAPLKETLAAAMIAASGWQPDQPLYDPCCGSGTIAIEAAQIALNIAPGMQRQFAFERYLPFQAHVWDAIKTEAAHAILQGPTDVKDIQIFGSDVAHRMVDFAQRNAERAGVAHAVQFRGGDALQRMPPSTPSATVKPVMLINPPYGERIEVAGIAGRSHGESNPLGRPHGESNHSGAQRGTEPDDFFVQLATHWKSHFDGWTAWILAPDMKLPGRMRLKESRRVPMWNGPIECRMFKFDIQGRRVHPTPADGVAATAPSAASGQAAGQTVAGKASPSA